MNSSPRPTIATIAWLTLSGIISTCAFADDGDPSARVARLAYIEGSVSFQPAGTSDWVAPPINRPLTTGDQLWSDRGSRAELQLDGSVIRLSANTAASLLNISNNVTQIQLSSGTLLLRVRRLDDNETYEIDTPNLAFSVLRPGLYRLTVDASGNSTAILIRHGQGEVTGGGSEYPMQEGEYDSFSGSEELSENSLGYNPDPEAFEAWSSARDARWDNSESARYVSADVVGYADLDGQGSWIPDPQYGPIWFPRAVETGWAPYHNGHWAYISPWGYTWVDNSPWGFAPFHYGRWVSVRGAWGWVPAPPRRPEMVYVRPVYAPALVAWVGIGSGVAWFALGPREVYVPSYHVSPRYVNNINVSNTSVNSTVVTNVYNTTIINKTVVNNITYVNRNVSGAVAATTSRAFTSAQPVRSNVVRVDERAMSAATVATLAPRIVPTKQAVLGSGRIGAMQPPAILQTRPVVARTAAPVAPPAFEHRVEAIKNNGGAPLSTDQVRQIASAPTVRAPVKIAPPAQSVAPARTFPQSRTPVAAAQPIESRPAPAPSEIARPAPNAIHPNELPLPRPPASPANANSVLERQHLQEQQQQQTNQAAERQRLEQQQETEHQRAAQAAADKARQQELERQHQVQTQQLAQQHAQQQQQLQTKQQDQKRQQDSLPPPKSHRVDGAPKP